MKIRRQVYSLDQYLMLMKDETIRSDQECQRLSEQWNQNMMNEPIFTVLTDNYMPPVILGEETTGGITKNYIIDGLQRSSTLFMFRYGNKKITKNLDEHMVFYQRKVTDEDGKVRRNENVEIIWETAAFDVRQGLLAVRGQALQPDGVLAEKELGQDIITAPAGGNSP